MLPNTGPPTSETPQLSTRPRPNSRAEQMFVLPLTYQTTPESPHYHSKFNTVNYYFHHHPKHPPQFPMTSLHPSHQHQCTFVGHCVCGPLFTKGTYPTQSLSHLTLLRLPLDDIFLKLKLPQLSLKPPNDRYTTQAAPILHPIIQVIWVGSLTSVTLASPG